MGKIMRNNIEYGGTESWTGTQAEYDALLIKYPNITYYITDTNGNEDQFQPVIYSLEEREIGVWTDGKPLYQKTYIYTPSAPLSVASLSIDKIIDMRAISHQTTGVADIAVPYGWDSSDRALFYYHSVNKTLNFSYSSMNSGEWYVTIRYTKTTDQAGSGTWTPQGVPAIHYSTSEHVVGTWIDGSTIYEKSFYYDIDTSSSYDIDVTACNMNELVNYELSDVGNTYYYSVNDYCRAYRVDIPTTTIRVVGGSYYPKSKGYITIRYTKTST